MVQLGEQVQPILGSLGLTSYESKAYLALLSLGVADAGRICQVSGVPSSKIYNITTKFELLGLIEIQHSKPAKFRALPPSVGLSKLLERKEKEIIGLKEKFPFLRAQLDSLCSPAHATDEDSFFSLEFGMQNHIQKHVLKLAEAERETKSYFETVCLEGARMYGAQIKRRLVMSRMTKNISSRILFGTSNKRLIAEFLKGIPATRQVTARVTKQIHSPFHVIDNKALVIVVDNPLLKDGRVASIYMTNRKLAEELSRCYDTLWEEARDVSDILS